MDGFHQDDDQAKEALVKSAQMLNDILQILQPQHGLGPTVHSLASTVEGTVTGLHDFVATKYGA